MSITHVKNMEKEKINEVMKNFQILEILIEHFSLSFSEVGIVAVGHGLRSTQIFFKNKKNKYD